MINELPVVIFSLDDQLYALRCSAVKRILQAVEISLLPNMPKDLLGVINVEGEIISIINIRERLALPNCALSLTDFIIIANSSSDTFGFVANDIDFSKIIHNEMTTETGVDIIKSPKGMIYLLDAEYLIKDQGTDLLKAIQSLSGIKEFRSGEKSA